MLVNFIKNAHAYPVVEVRNRALVISSTPVGGVTEDFSGATALTAEKYFDSNEDFLLWDVTGKPVITEQMTAYPVLDTSAGDFKKHATDPHAIFRLTGEAPIDVAVEICLDHSDRRLRGSTQRSPWPTREDGVALHLVPSCGMQLHPPAVAARAGGWAFNCDGQYALGDTSTAGTAHRGDVGGVACVYTDHVDAASGAYGSHTQLARVKSAAVGADVKAAGSHDATFDPASDVDVTVLPLTVDASFDTFFAGGPGAVHIYGKDAPLPL